MIYEKITLDKLTQNNVSVKRQKYIIIDDVEYPIGSLHSKLYINSIEGRQEIEKELPEAQRSAIFAVWGDVPTVIEENSI